MQQNKYQSRSMSKNVFADMSLNTTGFSSSCCWRAEDLQNGHQKMCCPFTPLHWELQLTLQEGLPFFNTPIIFQMPPPDPGPLASSHYLCRAGSVWVCECISVCLYIFRGTVCKSVSAGYIVSWLSSPSSLRLITSSCEPQGQVGPDGSWLCRCPPPDGPSQGEKSPWIPQMPVYLQGDHSIYKWVK